MAKSWVRHGFRERSRLPSRADDFTDIGKGYGALVTEDYNTPHGKFTGEISWVRIDIGKTHSKMQRESKPRWLGEGAYEAGGDPMRRNTARVNAYARKPIRAGRAGSKAEGS